MTSANSPKVLLKSKLRLNPDLEQKLANADGSPLLAALTELTDAQLEARTARALADATRAGLMAQSGPVIDVQAEAVSLPIVSATDTESST